MKFAACLFFATIACCSAFAGTLYKSVGPNGEVVYSDQPPANGKVEKTMAFSDLPASPLPESIVRYRQALEKSARNRLSELAQAPSGEFRLFTAPWCGYCRKARAYLADRNIPFREYDIDTPNGKQAFAQVTGATGIPVLQGKGKQLQGFTKASYDALFEK